MDFIVTNDDPEVRSMGHVDNQLTVAKLKRTNETAIVVHPDQEKHFDELGIPRDRRIRTERQLKQRLNAPRSRIGKTAQGHWMRHTSIEPEEKIAHNMGIPLKPQRQRKNPTYDVVDSLNTNTVQRDVTPRMIWHGLKTFWKKDQEIVTISTVKPLPRKDLTPEATKRRRK